MQAYSVVIGGIYFLAGNGAEGSIPLAVGWRLPPVPYHAGLLLGHFTDMAASFIELVGKRARESERLPATRGPVFFGNESSEPRSIPFVVFLFVRSKLVGPGRTQG